VLSYILRYHHDFGGNSPDAVTVKQRDGTAYVANSADNTVSIIDGVYDTVIATVPTGAQPTALAADPIEGEIYVANFAGNDVTKILDASVNIQFPNQVDIASAPEQLSRQQHPHILHVYRGNADTARWPVLSARHAGWPVSAANKQRRGAFHLESDEPLVSRVPRARDSTSFTPTPPMAGSSWFRDRPTRGRRASISGISAYAFTDGSELARVGTTRHQHS